MSENTTQEAAFFDFLDARERALEAAVGSFVVANVPTEHLEIIARDTTNEIIVLAARIVLHQRNPRP